MASSSEKSSNLQHHLDRITTEKKELRANLAELVDFVEHNSANLTVLNDKAWHKIYETLFQVVVTEKHTLLNSKATGRTHPSKGRLEILSSALRRILKAGPPNLKPKTLSAVVDHITQMLPSTDGKYFEPVLGPYLKAMHVVLGHQANVERMKRQTWLDVIDFCVEGINGFVEDSEKETNKIPRSSSGTGGRSIPSRSLVRSTSTSSNGANESNTTSLAKFHAEELLEILHLLVTPTSVGIAECYETVSKCVLSFWNALWHPQGSRVEKSFVSILSALNRVITYTRTDKISFTITLAQEVVPIISQFWQSKSVAKDEGLNAVRDEMLLFLFAVHPHLEKCLSEGDHAVKLLEDLSDVLKADYTKRAAKDQLQIDDLEMVDFGSDPLVSPFSLAPFGLRRHNIRGERNWAHLHVIGILEGLISIGMQRESLSDKPDGSPNHPSKRQKVTRSSDRIFDSLKLEDEKSRVSGLQMLPFILSNQQLKAPDLEELLDLLATLAADKRGDIAVWVLLTISSCTFQNLSTTVDSTLWLSLWRIGTRALVLSNTCRAAALQLHAILATQLLVYRDVSEDVSAIVTSADVNGPVILCDCSIFLMVHLLQTRIREVPSASLSTSKHAVRWLFAKWDPSDKSFASRSAIHVHPFQIMGLFRTSLGLEQLPLKSNTMLPLGRLAQAWQYQVDVENIVRYMLLLDDHLISSTTICKSCPKVTEHGRIVYFTDTSHFLTTLKLILELMSSKSSELLQSWRSSSVDDSSTISIDTFRSAVDTTMTMLLAMPHFFRSNLQQVPTFEACIRDLCKELLDFLKSSDARDSIGARALAESLVISIQPYLPPCDMHEFVNLSRKNPHLLDFLISVADAVGKRQSLHTNPSLNIEEDPMDVDDDFKEFSQHSHGRLDTQTSAIPRQLLALDASSASFDFVVASRLLLVANMDLKQTAVTSIPRSFIEKLCAMQDEELLLNHYFINELLRSDMTLEAEDATLLFERVLFLLKAPDFDLCEVSLVLALDCAIGLASLWLAAEAESELAEFAMDFYYWLAETALENMILSPELQKRSGELLLLLMKESPEYGTNIPLQSARSLLFTLLERSELCVKWYIADHLPEIFQLFLLEDHDAIFVDILEVLPSDSEWLEGMCFRVIALSKLASKWPTLQRRCIYHIFEVPEKVSESLGHAVQCMSKVSSALQLTNSRELFALFAPQILFTWLAADSGISNLPFEIFGFETLRDLISKHQDEVTGIMMMLGQDDEIEVVISLLGEEATNLFERSFTKIIAYTVAYDLSVPPPSSSEKRYITGESRLKKRLGPERFIQYLNNNFADIVALLFTISDPHDSLDKYLLQKRNLQPAGHIMSRIKALTENRAVLPPLTQPTFKAKKLSAQLDHLCTKTQFESSDIYTPALVVFIARKVSNTIHPALGSLHACAVLRKIRTLICFAGKSVTTGYPLEMLLQILQPYIKDTQCANDAIGIMQYLLETGIEHISRVPNFVAGISLSVFGSLKEIAKADRASSTQESQHKSTISRITTFHKWFGSYLRKQYMDMLPKSRSSSSLQRLFESACTIDWVGNADLRTSESDLLLRLLQDEHKSPKLLDGPSREIALQMLCHDFQAPDSFRTDVLGDDEASVANAVAVWKSCRGGISNKKYLSWASRVLGRAFAASGVIEQDLLRESSLSQMKSLTPKPSINGSQAGIVDLLQELTLGRNKDNIGLAEIALRLALSKSDDTVVQTFRDCINPGLYDASIWAPFTVPPSDVWDDDDLLRIFDGCYDERGIQHENWVRNLTVNLARSVSNDDLLHAVVPVLGNVGGFAEKAFPFIIHLVLSTQLQDQQSMKKKLSASFNTWFDRSETIDKNNLKVLINALLYLRTQPPKDDRPSGNRLQWLTIDYMKAATAATHCGMHKTALLFIEEHYSTPLKSSRRSSFKDVLEQHEMPVDILLDVFQSIEDPDMYYGVQQTSNLSTILARFEYEKDGPKSLAFRGAQFDSHIRRGDKEADKDAQSLVKALDVLSLSGLSHSLLQAQQSVDMSASSIESMYQTARKLEQWDIPVPDVSSNNSIAVYKAFQAINIADDHASIRDALDDSFNFTMNALVSKDLGVSDLHSSLQTLAALVEMDEIFSTRGSEQIEEMLARFEARSNWMKTGSFDDVSQILSCRGTALSTLSQRPRLQSLMNVAPVDTRLVEVRASLLASTLNRAHNALQESLSLATSMMDLIGPCRELSLNLDAAVHIEAANALWDQGETTSSIGILQGLDNTALLKKQAVPVSRADLLSKTGYQVSVARLEKADKIIDRYLRPALKELRGRIEGSDASHVFHQFAVFCDQQLEDPDSLEDLERLQKLSNGKRDEVIQWEKLLKAATSNSDRSRYKSHLGKAKIWYKLDEEELQRHMSNRQDFLRSSLENYLLALAASDDHDKVALRFTALWLEHADEDLANASVSQHLSKVPSRKFAPLMNQLTSRLQDSPAQFHRQLFSLVLRICVDHPYHGMYQIYSGTSTKPDSKDEAAVSRRDAARKVAARLSAHDKVGQIWGNLSAINKLYGMLAGEKDDSKYRSGKKINIKDTQAGLRLNGHLNKYRIPSPTLHLPLAADLDYSKIPVMVKLEPQMTIASGVSAPKIITAIADTGQTFKQLVKGGNDDLRQDAIMEQVFEQVSELLKSNRSTRQRDLKIRTYRVLPLTSIAGVIEFVPNTIPLHEYLMPAHERYNPKDLKGAQCRKEIGEVQQQSIDVRVKKYRSVTERFHPVMRYFFMEKFTDPDEWFVKRNAYTRSTAAISILGHVLGLGDRHGHNILLDSESGEVVHIDLGVAFEMGRVLPVPELVPFRLTRDIVDGMGITKTEGIFRRCCEFTLEALRKEAYSIMTILDVLRYDPLYNWSISPVRLARLQEGQSALANADGERAKEAVNEPGEADRALTVVNKKLSKTLSVQATVSDLINQASDEKNLAVLYSGWAAYA